MKSKEKELNSINSNVVIEIDYNSSRTETVGTYVKYGGTQNIDGDICCPTCSGNDVKSSDYIGFVWCNVCHESYPLFEFYNDIKKREEAFLNTVAEIKSNVDNYELLQVLDDDYKKRFYTCYLSQSYSGNTPKFIVNTQPYRNWIKRLEKDKEADTLKEAILARDNQRLTSTLWLEFARFLKNSQGNEAFNEESTTHIPKGDLIRELQRLTIENREMKDILKAYGMD